MNTKNSPRGFTLIELLVVIAIIGILSAVVLASLNTARTKGTDAAVKSDLDSSRAQAELYFDSHSQSYLNVCTTGSGGTPPGIQSILQGAAGAGGYTYVTSATLQTSSTVNCHDAANTWVAEAPLKNAISGNVYWCTDNTGTSTPKTTPLAAAATACPAT